MQTPDVTPELLEKISACAEIGNTIEEAATMLGMSAEALGTLIIENAEVRSRWIRGPIEAVNQLHECLTRQALAGSVQAAVVSLKLRGKLLEPSGKSAPISSASTSKPKETRRGEAWRPSKISEVAAELQVTAQYIRNMIRDASNPLPYEKRAGDWHVKAGAVYEWILKNAKRRPPNLVLPRGFSEPKEDAQTPVPQSGAIGDDTDLDVERILKEVYDDDKTSAAIAGKRLGVAREVRLLVESKLKREKMLPIADVVKAHRSFGELLIESIEDDADAQASEIIKVVLERLDIDLNQNPAAHPIIKSALCEHANKSLIQKIRQRVIDEVEGVQMLNLEGA